MFQTMLTIDLTHKRVFLRADLNVPLKDNHILQDYRLTSLLPTIDYLQKQGCKIILGTHLGRPHTPQRTHEDEQHLSTKLLIPWFTNKGYHVDFEHDLQLAQHKSKQHYSRLLLLENLRFFHGEYAATITFAQLLKPLADIYINDAFGMAHRADCSVTLLSGEFMPSTRGIGLLMQKEIETLSSIAQSRSPRMIVVIGGCKIRDKIDMLMQFLSPSRMPKLHSLIIGGALSLAFLKAQGLPLESAMIDDAALATATTLLAQAQQLNVPINLPMDMIVMQEDGSTITKTIHSLSSTDRCIDIGPATRQTFIDHINEAQTIFANGTMGIYEEEVSAQGTKEILAAIAHSNAYSVLGGGDAVAAAHLFDLTNGIDFLSTGGGATLAFLGSKDPLYELPALAALHHTE